MIYEPLIWAIDGVNYCPIHQQPLRTQCICGQQLPVLAKQARCGHCSRCREWLGEPLTQSPTDLDEHGQWELWCSQAINDLLAAAPALNQPPQRQTLTANITACIEMSFGGNASALAQALGLSDGIVRDWRLDRAIPRLSNLLRLCYLTNKTPLQLLTETLTLDQPVTTIQQLPPDMKQRTESQRLRVFPKSEIGEKLNESLQDTCFPPRSLSELARELGYDASHILKHFPQQCGQISARFLAYQKSQGAENRQHIYDEVRQITVCIHEEGHYPSLKCVKERVSKLAYALEPEGIVARHDVLQEMGLAPGE
jgi:transcriptional regulator with XRE-family HTH domain